MNAIVRDANPADLPQIQAINEHYVINTVKTFAVRRPSAESVSSKFEECQRRHLPYLVAVDRTGDKVLGYSYALGFRGSLGYGQCVEMSIFCHPANKSRGVGTKLMERLLQDLRRTKHIAWEHGHEDSPEEFQIKKIIAIVAVDDLAPLDLSNWYVQKWGFEKIGCLNGVGLKNGKMLDTIYLSKDL